MMETDSISDAFIFFLRKVTFTSIYPQVYYIKVQFPTKNYTYISPNIFQLQPVNNIKNIFRIFYYYLLTPKIIKTQAVYLYLLNIVVLFFKTSLIPVIPNCPPDACWVNPPSLLLFSCISITIPAFQNLCDSPWFCPLDLPFVNEHLP